MNNTANYLCGLASDTQSCSLVVMSQIPDTHCCTHTHTLTHISFVLLQVYTTTVVVIIIIILRTFHSVAAASDEKGYCLFADDADIFL